jgi:CelD/BcsL family acetyltransferase involved in cellulose biosynthesis
MQTSGPVIGAATSADRPSDRRAQQPEAPTVAQVEPIPTDLGVLETEWERVYGSRPHEPSTSFEWTRAMLANHVGEGDRVFLVRVTRAGETAALVPLLARRLRLFGLPLVLVAPIAERYNTHSDLLASSTDPAIARAFVEALFRLPIRWDVFKLTNILETHPLLTPIAAAAPRPAWAQRRLGYASYVLPLPPTFDTYLAARSGKFRNHLRRTIRKVEADGRARIDVIRAPEDVDRCYSMLLAIERASWKHDHGTAITAVPRQMRFYETLCRGAAARGHLHAQFLLLDEQPVAYNLGYLRDGRYAYLKTSYVAAHRELGIAAYLRARLIDGLIAEGATELDFPAQPYEWERQWADEVRWHEVLTIHRATPGGLALGLADRVKHRRQSRTVTFVDPRAGGPGGGA